MKFSKTENKRDMNLVVYLSYLCDLKCPYCYAENPGFSKVINKKILFSAVSDFLKIYAKNGKITVLGGEPLIHQKLLKELVRFVRKRSRLPFHLFTNGTKLTLNFLEFAEKNAIKIAISLNEFNFWNKKKKNKMIKTAALKGALASSVFMKKTLPFLARGIAEIYNFGFRHIAWTPDISEIWNKSDIMILEREIRKIKKFYFELMIAEKPLYEIGNMYEIMNSFFDKKGKSDYCPNIVLRPDGLFMPCDKAISARKEKMKEYLSDKISQNKRKNFFSMTRKNGAPVKNLLCPAGVFAYRKFVLNKDEKDIKKALRAQEAAARAIKKEFILFLKTAREYSAFREIHRLKNIQ